MVLPSKVVPNGSLAYVHCTNRVAGCSGPSIAANPVDWVVLLRELGQKEAWPRSWAEEQHCHLLSSAPIDCCLRCPNQRMYHCLQPILFFLLVWRSTPHHLQTNCPQRRQGLGTNVDCALLSVVLAPVAFVAVVKRPHNIVCFVRTWLNYEWHVPHALATRDLLCPDKRARLRCRLVAQFSFPKYRPPTNCPGPQLLQYDIFLRNVVQDE